MRLYDVLCRPGESLLEAVNQQQAAVPIQKAKLDEEVAICQFSSPALECGYNKAYIVS